MTVQLGDLSDVQASQRVPLANGAIHTPKEAREIYDYIYIHIFSLIVNPPNMRKKHIQRKRVSRLQIDGFPWDFTPR